MVGTSRAGASGPILEKYGDEAYKIRSMLDLHHPVQNGLVTDWEQMESVWHFIYRGICCSSEDHPVLLTEPLLNPKKSRERTTEIFFESLKVPKFYLAITATLAVYGSGRTTGMVLDVGLDSSSVVPVYEGYYLPHAIFRLELGGNQLTSYLHQLLNKNNYIPNVDIRELKEQFALCRETNELPFESHPTEYTLPDGTSVETTNELSVCPELFFNPPCGGCKGKGVVEAIHESVLKCDEDIHKDLMSNVVLSGNSSAIRGFSRRLENELKVLNDSYKTDVSKSDDRTWLGGSILASLGAFEDKWIDQSEYDESGPTIVHRKCF